MLYQTLSQPLVFLILSLAGFASGFLFDVAKWLKFLCENKKFALILFDFLATFTCFVIYFIAVLYLDFGEFRLFLPFAFLLGFSIQRKLIGKNIAKLSSFWYTKFITWRKHERPKKNKASPINRI